jgi:hypothetical protein
LEVLELTELTLNALLLIIGVGIIALILKVYELYRTMKINKTVMSPMLLAGFFMALSGVTELVAHNLGEMGSVAHSISTFLAAVFLLYGVYGYHQMLRRAVKLG